MWRIPSLPLFPILHSRINPLDEPPEMEKIQQVDSQKPFLVSACDPGCCPRPKPTAFSLEQKKLLLLLAPGITAVSFGQSEAEGPSTNIQPLLTNSLLLKRWHLPAPTVQTHREVKVTSWQG